MIDNEVTFQIWTSRTRRSLVTSRTRVRMSRILQARTYLFRSHSQLRDVITPLRDLYAGHSLLFSLSHNTPDLEHAISQLSSCSGETLGCLSSPLPVENPSHMFSCSIAVFEKERSVPFSTLESSDMTIQIGRARSYRKQEMEYEGNSNTRGQVKRHMEQQHYQHTAQAKWSFVWINPLKSLWLLRSPNMFAMVSKSLC